MPSCRPKEKTNLNSICLFLEFSTFNLIDITQLQKFSKPELLWQSLLYIVGFETYFLVIHKSSVQVLK